jgi:hypothetical protein
MFQIDMGGNIRRVQDMRSDRPYGVSLASNPALKKEQ